MQMMRNFSSSYSQLSLVGYQLQKLQKVRKTHIIDKTGQIFVGV